MELYACAWNTTREIGIESTLFKSRFEYRSNYNFVLPAPRRLFGFAKDYYAKSKKQFVIAFDFESGCYEATFTIGYKRCEFDEEWKRPFQISYLLEMSKSSNHRITVSWIERVFIGDRKMCSSSLRKNCLCDKKKVSWLSQL